MKTLVVAAHPDDEVLGCGGTLIKLANKQKLYSLVLNKGGRENPISTKEVSDYIGFTKSWQFDFPDNRFDTIPLAEIIKVIEDVKKEIKPDVVFTHFEHDLNKDHQLTYQAVLTATRPIAGETVKELYSFEIPSSTEWKFSNVFAPNVFIDISDTIEKKIEAFSMYKTEVRDYPHPRSPESMRVIAKRWGILSGLRCAEAFYLVRKI